VVKKGSKHRKKGNRAEEDKLVKVVLRRSKRDVQANYLCFEQSDLYKEKELHLHVRHIWICLEEPVQTSMVIRLFQKLEAHPYPNEPTPIGGFGEGVVLLNDKRQQVVEKIGKIGDVSPTKNLAEAVKTCDLL